MPMGAATYGRQGFKGRARVSGERPMGAASGRQQHNQASFQPPPPPPLFFISHRLPPSPPSSIPPCPHQPPPHAHTHPSASHQHILSKRSECQACPTQAQLCRSSQNPGPMSRRWGCASLPPVNQGPPRPMGTRRKCTNSGSTGSALHRLTPLFCVGNSVGLCRGQL